MPHRPMAGLVAESDARPAHGPVPRESLDRCSVRAGLRADPMLGTAFPSDRMLLVEQPGPWGRLGLLQSHFDPLHADRLSRACDAAGVRLLAIRRPGRSAQGAQRRFAVVDGRWGQERIAWRRFEGDRDLWRQAAPFVAGVMPAGDPSDRADGAPVYLVCTHGSHDACCAVRGRPIAAALAALAPERVWECSHVGGDRFAANVLVLPSGLLYGTVQPDELPALVAATERGDALPGPLRGKAGLRPEVQAALARAHQHWGGPIGSYAVDQVGPRVGNRVQVRMRRTVGGVDQRVDIGVRLVRSEVHRLTCQQGFPSAVINYLPEIVVDRGLSPGD